MAKSKEKKIKRLRKVRIWPSVMFLCFSIFLSVVTFIDYLTFSMYYTAMERFISICDRAEELSFTIDSMGELTEENMKLASAVTDGVYVLDKDGNIKCGFGEKTFDLTRKNDFMEDFLAKRRYVFYTDTDFSDNLVGKDGSLELWNLLNKDSGAKYVGWFQNGPPAADAVINEARLWKETAISDGETVIVKCSIPLYFKDFAFSALMAAGVILLMQLPIIFLFINIILGFTNQRKMTKLIYTDAVTGGKSYVYYEQYAGKALGARYNPNRMPLVADITLMKYRNYCNFHGARAGEALLESVDKTIASHLERKEFCAYSGKSSFALLMYCSDRQNGEIKVRKILGDLTEKFAHGGISFHAGICYAEPDKQNPALRVTDPSDCFNRASAARASAVDENLPACIIYDDKLLEEQLWEHKVEEKMQAALNNEEFQVYIQPKYDPVSEKLVGAEALVRWINEEDGFISPGRFIPIFEKNGFITQLDDYMLSHVAKLQAQWLAEGKDIVPISVNVSRAHFANPDLAQHICSIVDKYSVPHHFIEIELTESAFFDDKAALLRTVHQLRELGFEISMDDFGAGYSSLNSLKDLPLDVLKLDAEFFRGEDEANRGEIVVSQAIRLAKSLNMRIVAEGVEKKEQVDFLAGQGCDMIQGFYFAKPMPASEYEQRLQQPNN